MLVDALTIRASLLEICREIERSMVVFGARLEALSTTVDGADAPPAAVRPVSNLRRPGGA
jgi:hypothetical protein